MPLRSLLIFSLALGAVVAQTHGQSTVPREIRGVPGDLALAISQSDEEAIGRLLAKAFANGVPSGCPVVLFARTPQVLDSLVSKGANLWAVDPAGMNVLMVSAQDGDAAMVDALLERGAKVNAKDFLGRSALYFAAGNLDDRVAMLLLRAGAYVDNQTSSGETVIHRAAEQFNLEVFELLLASGVNWRIKDQAGRNVREFIEHGQPPPLDDKERTIRETMLERVRHLSDRVR